MANGFCDAEKITDASCVLTCFLVRSAATIAEPDCSETPRLVNVIWLWVIIYSDLSSFVQVSIGTLELLITKHQVYQKPGCIDERRRIFYRVLICNALAVKTMGAIAPCLCASGDLGVESFRP